VFQSSKAESLLQPTNRFLSMHSESTRSCPARCRGWPSVSGSSGVAPPSSDPIPPRADRGRRRGGAPGRSARSVIRRYRRFGRDDSTAIQFRRKALERHSVDGFVPPEFPESSVPIAVPPESALVDVEDALVRCVEHGFLQETEVESNDVGLSFDPLDRLPGNSPPSQSGCRGQHYSIGPASENQERCRASSDTSGLAGHPRTVE
jgi:hypothetical protein